MGRWSYVPHYVAFLLLHVKFATLLLKFKLTVEEQKLRLKVGQGVACGCGELHGALDSHKVHGIAGTGAGEVGEADRVPFDRVTWELWVVYGFMRRRVAT